MSAKKLAASSALVAIVIALVVTAVCRSCKPPTPADFVTVKVGYMPIADAAPVFVGIENGLFKKASVRTEMVSFRGGSLIINAVKSGAVDLGFSNILSFILSRSEGLGLVSLGGVAVNDREHKEGAIIVAINSPAASIQDLKGKKIAVNARKNIVELSITKLLRKNNLCPEDVRFVEVPFPQMETVLKSGEVDAIAVAEPFWTFALRHGTGKVLAYYYADVYDEIEITSWFATQQWIQANPDLATKLNRILAEAVDYLNEPSNQNTVRAIIAKYTQTDAQTASEMGMPTFRHQFTVSGLEAIMEDMVQEKFLKKRIEIRGLFFE